MMQLPAGHAMCAGKGRNWMEHNQNYSLLQKINQNCKVVKNK
jgi:hypothetical protein